MDGGTLLGSTLAGNGKIIAWNGEAIAGWPRLTVTNHFYRVTMIWIFSPSVDDEWMLTTRHWCWWLVVEWCPSSARCSARRCWHSSVGELSEWTCYLPGATTRHCTERGHTLYVQCTHSEMHAPLHAEILYYKHNLSSQIILLTTQMRLDNPPASSVNISQLHSNVHG